MGEDTGLEIIVKVKPNTSRTAVIKHDEKTYTVYLTKPAHDNKANEELIRVLRRHFKTHITITRGHTTRTKQVFVHTIS